MGTRADMSDDEFWIRAASIDGETVFGAVDTETGAVLGTAVIQWPAWMTVSRCTACCRPIEVCVMDVCPKRDPVEPWKMLP